MLGEAPLGCLVSPPKSTTFPPSEAIAAPTRPASGATLWRALAFVSIAAVSAGVAYAIVRATILRPPPPDPTSERIQSLIDEANRLLKTLDDQKRG